MLNFQDLPDELVLKILGYSETKDLITYGQVSKRIRKISHDRKLWATANLVNQIVKTELLEIILGRGCTTLNISNSIPVGCLSSNIESQLKALDLSRLPLSQSAARKMLRPGFCKENLDVLEELLFSCCSLKHLKMEGFFLTPKMAESICKNGKTLQVLNLNNLSVIERYSITNRNFQAIIQCCQELKEVDLVSTISKHKPTDDDLEFLAKNISPNVVKLNLEFQNFTDDHVKILLSRCNKIKVLILEATNVTSDSLKTIKQHLSLSLEKLTMDYYAGHKPSFMELKSMQRLKLLNLYSLQHNEGEIQNLRHHLPHLIISTFFYDSDESLVENDLVESSVVEGNPNLRG